MYISYLYVQTVTHQCFCFPNSQWGVTAHDIPPQREDRKLDILENISFLLHETETCHGKAMSIILFTQSVRMLSSRINQSRVRS